MRGLSHLQGGRFTTYTTADGLAGNVVRALLEDRDGHIWVGTSGWRGERAAPGVVHHLLDQERSARQLRLGPARGPGRIGLDRDLGRAVPVPGRRAFSTLTTRTASPTIS